jgi:mevalonate kinase
MIYESKANGKFLLTGEYAVLDGARALAVPLQRGQWLRVREEESSAVPTIHWRSLDQHGQEWFSMQMRIEGLEILQSTDQAISDRLRQILLAISDLGSTTMWLSNGMQLFHNLHFTTEVDFDRAWGLGTSSTLIALLADWANMDQYALLAATFGGSGYDVACAFAKQPIVYARTKEQLAHVEPVDFQPPADARFYFVYLNQKMNSRDAIRAYRSGASSDTFIRSVTDLTDAFLDMRDLQEAQQIMKAHEALLAKRLGQIPVKNLFFADFPGAVKSMGAWGGDFVLAATHLEPKEMTKWCNLHGFPVFFEWSELVI